MRRRTAVVAVAALAGCTPGPHHEAAPPADPARAIPVAPAPRPVELEASRSAPLPSPSQSPGEGGPHTAVTAAQGPPAVVRDLGLFRATCYAESGRTASGAPAGEGSVAVDPAVIPLGTHLHVAGWGSGTADDTGGAIRGHRVDVWLPSYAACIAFGVRWVDVVEEAA